jgi:hypothetical protein
MYKTWVLVDGGLEQNKTLKVLGKAPIIRMERQLCSNVG